MEKAGVELIKDIFASVRNKNPIEIPSLVLAYVGDAVYELAVREYLVGQGLVKVNRLHRETVKYVRASAQAKVLFALEDRLSDEEMAVIRRGRNTKSSVPKNADVIEYRHATAFEALIGFLYLRGDQVRLQEIIASAIETIAQG